MTVLVAVSGGADSLSLLLAMHELRQREKLAVRLVAAHFNHGIRDGESDADEEFVRKLASERKIELAVGHGKVSRDGNLEQNARLARYEFLKTTAENLKAHYVLTGHTINDQAETFLLNLIRGSGPDGLSGMTAVRNLASESTARLVRPMLTWAKRSDTEGYCHDLGVEYRYDTMNEDTAFKRVRIRKILLPLLEDFNPQIVETLANTAALMQQVPRSADQGNRLELADELFLADLKQLSEADLQALIRDWLGHHRGSTRQLALKHIEAVVRLVLSTKSGRMAEIPGGQVIKTGGRLVYREN
ncbi:MAG: tRNA lysidine(34) synthetase TilS [Pyrinomonadaceae bacterium]